MTPPFVKRYLIALDQHKLIAVASFAVIVGVSGVVAIQPPPSPTYKAEGTLAYNTPATSFSTTGVQIQEQGRQLTPEILLADNVVNAAAVQARVKPQDIIRKLKLNLPKEGKKDDAPVAPVIEIEYTADNQTTAKTVLDVLMQKMVEQSRLINSARVRAITGSVEQRLPEAQKALRNAEQQLERYDRTEGPALFAAQDGTLVKEITDSQQQQRQLQITLSSIDAQINSLVNKLGLTPDQAYTSSALSADPIIANLRAQLLQAETQLEILSRDLRPEHPQMVALLRQKEAYETLLRERAAEVLGGNGVAAPLPGKIRQDSSLDPARQQLANALSGLQTQRDALQQQLQAIRRTEQQLREQYQGLPNKQLERGRLAQQVQLQQDFYNKLLTGLADAKAAETEAVSSLSVAQAPQVSIEQEKVTNPAVTLGAGTFIALLVAGGLILLLATLDNTFHTPEEIRQSLAQREVPVLAELPLVMFLDPEQGDTAILAKPDSPYLEFYERFRSNLRRVENKSLRVVLLTSTVEREGKSVSAYNLAIASAQAGKRTLLVEGDLRSPSLSKTLKVVCDPNATIEPLRYYSAKSDCIRLVPDIENLYIMPSPGPQRQAAAILESSELQQFLEDARGRFDFVVIDTPALSRCNDALLIEPLTDGIVIVTRPGYTQESILAEAVEELTEAELPLLGAIINGVDKPVSLTTTKEITTEYQETTIIEQEELEKDDNIKTGAMRF
ncbi:MAG: lipopolysaccharide biosynthesis [Symplocastrum torsivum CPER-KK1]|jgi:capsular exopolysaccharide synthesis family protein|uniref:Lipopolysaccharide biosynthesis n=1 Tax=Symplocastrum torsivum CPER-KK1 TaxID=450513 RepID=A0A951PQ02_9CYAN|nr:lipopolysaccharide biosynthesis [Symplocastrum torsivum CPER-KK1]